MNRRGIVGSLAVALAVAAAVPAAAQETGTPVFKSPYRTFTTSEVGVTFSDPGAGVDWALEGFYGYGRGRWDIGLRGGVADFSSEDTGILLGASARTRVLESSESFPLDGALTLGAGAMIVDGDVFFRTPIGISVGRRVVLEGSETSFVPYAHPVLVPVFGAGDSDVGFALGLGVDIKFGRTFDIRVAGALGDYEGVSIGAAFIR